MTRRRELLKTLLLAVAALPAARLLRAAPAAAAPAQAAARSFVVVDGWVLTEADLARIGDAL